MRSDVETIGIQREVHRRTQTEKWKPFENTKLPEIYRAVLDIKDTAKDIFMKLDNWTKTVAYVNGFNVERLWNIGPQYLLYIPAPFLKNRKMISIYLNCVRSEIQLNLSINNFELKSIAKQIFRN
jgi:hypothetical protein